MERFRTLWETPEYQGTVIGTSEREARHLNTRKLQEIGQDDMGDVSIKPSLGSAESAGVNLGNISVIRTVVGTG